MLSQSTTRNWLFRQAIDLNNPPPLPPLPSFASAPSAQYEHAITHTPVSLFRFSALTFNAHKIHYDRDWCRKVEGHRDCVVHGPLNLIHMVDFWRHVIGKSERGTVNDKLTVLLPKKGHIQSYESLLCGGGVSGTDGGREGESLQYEDCRSVWNRGDGRQD